MQITAVPAALAKIHSTPCPARSTEEIPGTDNDKGQYVIYTVRLPQASPHSSNCLLNFRPSSAAHAG